jgi:hypothetical protein
VGVLEASERRASRRRYRGLLSAGGWADRGLAGGGGTGGRTALGVRRWEKVEVVEAGKAAAAVAGAG